MSPRRSSTPVRPAFRPARHGPASRPAPRASAPAGGGRPARSPPAGRRRASSLSRRSRRRTGRAGACGPRPANSHGRSACASDERSGPSPSAGSCRRRPARARARTASSRPRARRYRTTLPRARPPWVRPALEPGQPGRARLPSTTGTKLRSCSSTFLFLEEPALARDSPAVAAERAVGPHDPMARHERAPRGCWRRRGPRPARPWAGRAPSRPGRRSGSRRTGSPAACATRATGRRVAATSSGRSRCSDVSVEVGQDRGERSGFRPRSSRTSSARG